MAGRLNRAAWYGFDLAFAPWMNHHLRTCMLSMPHIDAFDGPVMLVSNHVSWWDGFLLRQVQRLIRPGSPLYTIALERELKLHPILRLIGGVGVVPSSPTSILRAARGLQERVAECPNAVIGYFPQGCITPSFRRPLGFARGLEFFARKIGTLTVIPIALHIEPLAGMAPTAFVRIGEPQRMVGGAVSVDSLQRNVSELLDATLASLSLHGERSVSAMTQTAAIEPRLIDSARRATASALSENLDA
ncbi:MAG: lysophospholipid acyltransferase family protein [Gemmatimonadota bacterium]|nr:lysophospholipid acyltransferase family protein [Gemmatimonadota bacterium]